MLDRIILALRILWLVCVAVIGCQVLSDPGQVHAIAGGGPSLAGVWFLVLLAFNLSFGAVIAYDIACESVPLWASNQRAEWAAAARYRKHLVTVFVETSQVINAFERLNVAAREFGDSFGAFNRSVGGKK